ncbi:methyl-accepting chemotaxis protein [Anaeromyxobacter paludicola]|uniref:Methyl-accepting chemotaxis sensory transducer n=1 Tax=Anaeromyxobacter paludicola TaxID=2918171 RepID=A0ABN6NAY9_9BACT|nr:methyl-accepting chemotaxis protein [Anaeromyxobacter paludicola]BDG09483.1 hypothetical protein AMPC_25960 [Anaeromyxobacter paludicola]
MFLGHLSFRQKMAILPISLGLAFLAVLCVNTVFQSRSELALRRIEQLGSPSLRASRDLELELEQLQEVLEHAVEAQDPEQLAASADQRDAFLRRVGELRRLQRGPGTEVDQIEQGFADYYRLARDVSARLIARDVTGITEPLESMQARYRALQSALAETTRFNRDQMARDFADARHQQDLATWGTAGVIGACAFLLSLLGGWIARSVAQPLGALSRAAARVASDGDLGQAIEVRGNGEVADLARAFAEMMEKLRQIPIGLHRSAEELARASAELETASHAQAAALEAEERALAEARGVAESMTASGGSASEAARVALRVAAQAERAAEAGQRATGGTLEGLAEIGGQVETLLAASQGLGERLGALESSALALGKSAVHATDAAWRLELELDPARGGAGAALAVEVHRLSQQVSQGAAQLGAALRELGRAARQTTGRGDEGRRRIDAGMERIRAAGEHLREISALLQQSSQATRQIVKAVEEEAQALAGIGGALVKLDEVAARSAAGARRTAKAADAVRLVAGRVGEVVRSFKL